MSVSHLNICVLRIFNVALTFLITFPLSSVCLLLFLIYVTAFTPQATGINYPLVSPTAASVNLGLINSAASLYQTLAQPTVNVLVNHVVRNIQMLRLSCRRFN